MNLIKKTQSKYRYSIILLKQLVITDFKLRYKGSALGYLWSLLRPLALFAVLYVIFVHFLRFGANIPHFAVSLLVGVVLWNYFVEVTTNGLSSIVGRGDLMRKLSFPRYVIVVAGSFSALINLAINLIVVGVFIVINGVDLTWHIFLLIPLIIELFLFSLSIAFLLSALYVKFRDVNYIWELLVQAGFYATPIVYPIATVLAVSAFAAKLMLLSPIAQIIQDVRWATISQDTPTTAALFGNFYVYLVPLFIVVFTAIFSTIYFKKQSPKFAEEI